MARLRKTEYTGDVFKDPYERIYEMPFGNFTIERGDLIKVSGVATRTLFKDGGSEIV